MKIKTKLILSFLVFPIALFIGGLIYIAVQFNSIEDKAYSEAASDSRLIAELLGHEHDADGTPSFVSTPSALQHFIEDFHRNKWVTDFEVLDTNKKIIADIIVEDIGNIFNHDPNNEVSLTLKDGKQRRFIEISKDYPEGIKQIVTSVRTGEGETRGALIMDYTFIYNRLFEQTKSNLTILASALLTTIILSLILGFIISGKISKPITALRGVSEKISQGNWETRAEIKSKDEIGLLAGAFNSMIDKRNEYEKEIVKSTERFNIIAKATNDCVYDWNLLTNQIWWNEGLARLFNYPHELTETDIHWWEEKIHPDDMNALMQSVQNVFDEKLENWSGEYRFKREDGSYAFVSDRGFILYDENKNSIRWLGSLMDISERKLAENALSQSEKKHRALIETTNTGFLVLDAQGKIVDANAEYVRLTGYNTLAEIVGREVTEWTAPYDLERNADEVKKCAEKGYVRNLEIDYVNRRGEITPIEVNATVVVSNGVAQILALCRDITERRKAEEIIKSNETKFRTLFDSTTDAIFIMDGPIFIDCNIQAEKLFEHPRKDIIGRSPMDFSPERQPNGRLSSDMVIELVGAVLQGEPQLFEWKLCRSDGSIFDAEVGLNKIELGNIVYLQVVARDISKRKQAEEQINMLAAAIKNSADSIAITDKDFNIIFVNDALMKSYGYTKEGIIGQHISKIHSENNPPEVANEMFSSLMKKETWQGEVLNKKSDGINFSVLLSLAPIVNEKGEVISTVGISRDITERKKAEKKILTQSKALESAANAIVITDIDGTILWINPAFTKLTGYTSEEAIGKNPRVLKSEKHDDGFYKEMWRTILAGNVWQGEITNRKKNGDLYYEHLTITPIVDANGKVFQFVAVKQDITERKQAEQKLRQLLKDIQDSNAQLEEEIMERKKIEAELVKSKDAAETANKTKSEFLANMSHEIRTPMNGIIGMIELALDTDLNKEQQNYISTAKSSAELLLILLNDILDFSKIEADKLTLNKETFSLRDKIGDSLQVLSQRAAEKKLELLYQVTKNVPDAIIGDPHRLRQVMINLVGNAIKFTQQGEVVVRVECGMDLNETESGQDDDSPVHQISDSPDRKCKLHFTVSDTGVGIAPEKQHLIFDVFTQADGTISRKYGGTGLGLAISSRLVTLMGGKIWVESEPGKGSKFHFTMEFGKQEVVEEEQMLESNLQNLPVLIVDDNETTRELFSEILTNWKMKPSAVESAQKALAELQRAFALNAPYAITMTDLDMPGMDGFELIERIKNNPELKEMGIIIISHSQKASDIERGKKLGVEWFHSKPFRHSQLLETIQNILRKQSSTPKIHTGEWLETVEVKPAPEILTDEYHYRILLAEDNPVNQEVVVGLLSKRGHTVIVANEGNEAVELSERHHFDFIIMDVQMPVMDGHQATAAIREREKTKGGHIPIIGLTAHAMTGDRERCIEAGMDEYVSKPLRKEELFKAIEKIVPKPSKIYKLDEQRILERVEGDRDLFKRLVDVFLDNTPKLVSELRDAIVKEDFEQIRIIGHTLKGSCRFFEFKRAGDLSEQIEFAGKAMDRVKIKETQSLIEKEIRNLLDMLNEYRTLRT